MGKAHNTGGVMRLDNPFGENFKLLDGGDRGDEMHEIAEGIGIGRGIVNARHAHRP